jgi:hypothetical protein
LPGIVHGHELEQSRLAGVAIDLEHRDVAAEWIRVVGRLEERFVAETRLETRRQRDRDVGIAGDVGERLAGCRRTFDEDLAVLEDEVLFVRFHQRGRELGHLRFHLGAGHVQRRAADRLRAAAEGADALLHDAGVAVQDRDVLERHPN